MELSLWKAYSLISFLFCPELLNIGTQVCWRSCGPSFSYMSDSNVTAQTLELIFRKTISVKCLDEPNIGIDFPENDFRDSQTAENIFLFRKLAFPENMYFPEIVLRQTHPNTGRCADFRI